MILNLKGSLKCGSDLDEELYDEFLSSILNADKVVQIGEWLFKLDLESKVVRALNEDNIDVYSDLVNDVENEFIYNYSSEEDVLDLIQNGQYGTSLTGLKGANGLFCRDKYASSKTSAQYKWSYVEFKLHYTKAGVYFSLYSKVKKDKLVAVDYITGSGYFEYNIHARCKDWNQGPTWHGIKFNDVIHNEDSKIYVYRRTRAAEKYRARINWTGKYKTYEYVNGEEIETLVDWSLPQLKIESNYSY